MRTKTLFLFLVLCVLLAATGWTMKQTEDMQQEYRRLETRLQELRAENDALACRLAELRELQAIREEQVVWRLGQLKSKVEERKSEGK